MFREHAGSPLCLLGSGLARPRLGGRCLDLAATGGGCGLSFSLATRVGNLAILVSLDALAHVDGLLLLSVAKALRAKDAAESAVTSACDQALAELLFTVIQTHFLRVTGLRFSTGPTRSASATSSP